MRRLIFLLLFLVGLSGVKANNVRIVKDVTVGTIVNGMVDLKFTVAWDNSWRDDFNWDAVYIFMKYKKTTETDWKHAMFGDEGHVMSAGYDYYLARNTTTANYHQGVFVFRNDKKRGAAEVEATLKWNVGLAGYKDIDFQDGNVEMSLMCIEMVYIPKGAFYLGDGISKNTFRTQYRPILPEWDLIKNDGKLKFSATNTFDGTDPQSAANRVNETRNNSSTGLGNYWRSNPGSASWTVEFPEPKTVRYFGVSGLSGYTGYVPSSWTFEASVDGKNSWKVLSDGNLNGGAWPCASSSDSYPISQAIAVKEDMVGAYKFYRIRITTAGSGVMLSNISMTEVDMSKVNDNGFIVDGQAIPMNATTGLSADDGDSWTGSFAAANTQSAIYPTGFEGFYAMKYEISQEQWVRFLNKLNPDQQKKRTREDLGDLNDRDYVYGPSRDKASARNGIVIGARVNGAVIFACDLNPENNVSQDDDGQTLACNFLSVNDMLAYADWAGLRPLSEMEFEKMGRRPYPSSPGLKDWAGGNSTAVKLPTGKNFSGTMGQFDERLTDANVNAGGLTGGPVRVGSFAKGAKKPSDAGASYWGVMDLSGNLAEIYYNANTKGRNFRDRYEAYNHGDGALDGNAAGNVSTSYWPVDPACFGLRGGSYRSEIKGMSEGEIAISDRSKIRGVAALTEADSTTTFRLGHSCTYLTYGTTQSYNSYLKLENGKLSSTGNGQFDSVCVNTTYTIKGSELLDKSNMPVNFPGKTNYIWYISENSGTTWRIMSGQNGQDLVYSDWKDESVTVRPVWIKREIITPVAMHMSNYVVLNVVNNVYSVDRLVDTLRASNQALGFMVATALPASFTWRWKSAPNDAAPLQAQHQTTTFSWYVPQRSDFEDISKQNHVVQCEIKASGKCLIREEMTVFLEERLGVAVASTDITIGGTDKTKECGVLMQDVRPQSGSGIYGTVRIGDKCWMSQNLQYDGISGVAFGTKLDDPNGDKYGLLYQFNAVLQENICPAGWRLPLKTEYDDMTALLGGNAVAGPKIRSGNYWTYHSENFKPTNETGFGAMAVASAINVANNGSYAYFGTYDGLAYYTQYNVAWFNYYGGWGNNYFSIRCIKR